MNNRFFKIVRLGEGAMSASVAEDRLSTLAPIRSVGFLVLLAVMLSTGPAAKGTSIFFHKFSTPILNDNRLVFLSPDARRLLCVDFDGKLSWEKKYDFPIRLFAGPKTEALVQTGRVVSSVSPQSGELRTRFTVEDENDEVDFSSKLGSYVSRDRRFEKCIFKLLDRETGRPIWRTGKIEDVICATPDLIVCVAAPRIPIGRDYKFGQVSLDGYARGSFKRKWSIPLPEHSGDPWVPAAFKAPYLVYAEGSFVNTDGRNSLTVLDCNTGRKRLTKQVKLPNNGWISAVAIHEDQLVWLTHEPNLEDFNSTEHQLHFCTIPELKEQKAVVLRLIEIAHISFESGFIISDALYRTACFREEGEKVWERFQTSRTPVLNNRIYFSDNEKQITRIGYVEVSTGKETILYSEPVGDFKR